MGSFWKLFFQDAVPDFIIGNETWLDNSMALSEIIPNTLGYEVHSHDKLTDAHGGVLIAVKRGFMLSNIYNSYDLKLISGKISVNSNKSLTMASYTIDPLYNRTNGDYLSKTNEEITSLRRSSKQDRPDNRG